MLEVWNSQCRPIISVRHIPEALLENKSVHHNASVSNFSLTSSRDWHQTVPELEDEALLLFKIFIT